MTSDHFNPMEVLINIKRVDTPNGSYFIGNCDMEIEMKDTVLMIYMPKDNERYTKLTIRKFVPEDDDDDNGNKPNRPNNHS